MTTQPLLLKDTCLCAIVRDEVINPAGGIVDFVDSTVPYVEQAVIVDTGSIDGTRALLEREQEQHSNLQVYVHKFKGFANARNYSLRKGRALRYALVLDADERLTEEDFRKLFELLENIKRGFNFKISNIYPNGIEDTFYHAHNPRIFINSCFYSYFGKVYEISADLLGKPLKEKGSVEKINLAIKHFVPDAESARKKVTMLYDPLKRHVGRFSVPSTIPGFSSWKQLNPHREKYR